MANDDANGRRRLFDYRISVGNVLTMVLMLAAVLGNYYSSIGRLNEFKILLDERSADVVELRGQMRAYQSSALILEGRLTRIETQLERILKAVEQANLTSNKIRQL